LLPEHARGNIKCDYIVPYQGISKVLPSVENITGLTFTRNLKPPSYELLGEYYYAPVLTSTGCVFNCAYCAVDYLMGDFSRFPFSMIGEMIIDICKTYGVDKIAFYDDALLFDSARHIDKIIEMVLESGCKVRFFTPNGLHVRFLTEKTAYLMKQAGFTDIRLSLESQDEKFHEAQGKKAGLPDFINAMEILTRAGFRQNDIKCYILVNVPGEDRGGVSGTMETVFRLGALPMLSYFSPIPHTPDYDRAAKITDVSEPLFQNNNVYLYRSGFNMEYLAHLKSMELSFRKGYPSVKEASPSAL
jgi:radical SAM superfamily enzyme YgiQ (UPF0313 family)